MTHVRRHILEAPRGRRLPRPPRLDHHLGCERPVGPRHPGRGCRSGAHARCPVCVPVGRLRHRAFDVPARDRRSAPLRGTKPRLACSGCRPVNARLTLGDPSRRLRSRYITCRFFMARVTAVTRSQPRVGASLEATAQPIERPSHLAHEARPARNRPDGRNRIWIP